MTTKAAGTFARAGGSAVKDHIRRDDVALHLPQEM